MTSVAVEQTDNRYGIRISGRFDFTINQAFRRAYQEVTQAGTQIRVDLSATDYMDSSALGMLLLLKDHTAKHGLSLVLQHPSAKVAKLLEVANFYNLFEIDDGRH